SPILEGYAQNVEGCQMTRYGWSLWVKERFPQFMESATAGQILLFGLMFNMVVTVGVNKARIARNNLLSKKRKAMMDELSSQRKRQRTSESDNGEEQWEEEELNSDEESSNDGEIVDDGLRKQLQ
ncbi:MAG: hypothetical protein CUN57_02935, partial [Phototrophicales bacterium]